MFKMDTPPIPEEEEPPQLCGKARSEMETWRLSRIDEELSKLDIQSSNMAEGGESNDTHSPNKLSPASPRNPRPHSSVETYSKITVRPVYQNMRDFKLNYKAINISEERMKQAVDRISQKYDSLDKMRIPNNNINNNNYCDCSRRERSRTMERPKPPNRTSSFSKDADVRPFSGRFSQLYDSQENGLDSVFEEENYWETQMKLHDECIDQLITPLYERNMSKARSLPRDVTLTSLLRTSPIKTAGIHGRRSVHLSNDLDDEQEVPARVEKTPPLLRANPSPQNSPYRGRSPKVSERRGRNVNEKRSHAPSRAVSQPPPIRGSLSEQDILQVSLFYQSHKTDIFVSRCLARLYFSSVRTSDSIQQDTSGNNGWKLVKTGVPVLVLDTGESRRQRRLYVVVAERGTGFALWRDIVNHLTNYKSPTSTFHTMHMSSDHSKVAGLRFDDPECAKDFYKAFQKFTANPVDPGLNLSKPHPKSKGNARFQNKKGKYKAPDKSDISYPVCFTHVTMMNRPDAKEKRSTIGEPPSPSGNQTPKLPKHGILKRSVQV